MGGSSKKQTVGYWYKLLYHAGLSKGPIDAFLEFRGGDKTAWKGALTASGTISVNAPNLWGGEQDQGGIVGDVDVMFGEVTQAPNAYLLANLGSQVPAWRGLATLVFKGGKYGAMNPYPQKASYKIRKIQQGWDGACWYPETAEIRDAPPILIGQWRHIEMSCAGNVVRLFTGGKLVAEHTLDYTPNGGVGGQCTIARYSAASSDGGIYLGYLRNMRVTKAVRHTVDFTPSAVTPSVTNDPLWGSVISMLPLTGPDASTTFTDVKGNAWTLYDGTVAVSSGASLDGQPSAHFTGGNIRTPYTSGINVGSSFTIDFWLNVDAPAGVPICWNQLDAIHAGYALQINGDGSVGVTFGRNTWPAAPVILNENITRNILGMNPAHALFFSRTNSDMGRESDANMNSASLAAAANQLMSEQFAICTTRDPINESVEEFEQRICKLIDGAFQRDPITGQWHLDLARGDYVLGDLPILTDDDILDFKELPSTLDNAVNSVSVKYFDPEKKETITTAPVQARALTMAFGTIHQTIDYPEIPTADLAARVALRELRAVATPTRAFDLVCTRKPLPWRVNTYFRVQAPKRGIADMVCIVGEKESGSLKSGAIRLKAAQNIYSMPTTSFVEVEPGVDTDPSQTPAPITAQAAFEAPYIEVVNALSRADLAVLPADVGYLMTVSADPAHSVDYTVMVDAGAGYLETSHGDWAPTATIVEASGYVDTSFTVASSSRLAEVVIGSAALWGTEIVRIDALDVVTGAITLGRACADSVPVKHAAGDRIWFYQGHAAIDSTEYTDGETLDIKLLTNTGSQQLALANATAIPLTFAARADRPYPPANVKINGIHFPQALVENPLITISWAHRDRLLQADQLVDFIQGNIGPEAGTTYTLRLYGETDTLLRTEIGLTGTSYVWSAENADSGLTISGSGIAADYDAEVAADAPTSLWRMDETTGTTATDSIGSNHGTYAGATLNQASLIVSGRSVLFSGAASGITIPDAASLSFVSTAFSLECWVKTLSVAASSLIVKDTSGTIFPEYALLKNASGTITCTVRSANANTPNVTATTTIAINDGKRHHVVAVFTPSSTLKIYIDGIERASASHSLSTSFNSAASLRLGRDGGSAAYFSGTLDEIALYATALSPARISAHYAAGVTELARLNGRVRIELESVRGGVPSYQKHNFVVDRAGWGYNWGNYWGGS